ncbi:MAG: N-6 DNA methylase, partial [Elusimicrobiota bacterium]
NLTRITQQGVNKIVDTFRKYKTEKRHSRVVDLKEIEANNYNLNISLYVDTTQPTEDIDVKEEIKRFKQLKLDRDKIEKKMLKDMKVLGYE